MNIEILDEAAAQTALNLFKIKYPEETASDGNKHLKECISDTAFIINNFMRISADLASKREDS